MTCLRQPLALALLIRDPSSPWRCRSGCPRRWSLRAHSSSHQRKSSGRIRAATIRSTVELVVVPVTVKDARGNLVGDLRQDEFRIFEDGVEQHISLFRPTLSRSRPWWSWMTT